MDRLSLHHTLCPWGRQRPEERACGETVRASWICVGCFLEEAGASGSEVGTGGRAVEGQAQGPGLWRESGCLWGTAPAGSGGVSSRGSRTTGSRL